VSPDDNLIYDVSRLSALIGSAALGFTEVARERFRATYAHELR